ncbi:class I SAM-dependent methyltransferase [Lichenicoccus sp.]|uniref:class I SAM-dependent methyltransferase n=1 Tax=Lichenicoccus sp. TaxID=2781899 RepID=UPI003D112469
MSDPVGLFAGLAGYLEQGISKVEGWLSPVTASMIAHLLVGQSLHGLRGDVCEIGVHHGKLFLVLACATLPEERAVAIDVFGDHDKNLDCSGAGDRGIFEAHLAAYAPGAEVEIIQRSSLELAKSGFLDRRFRLISIDGGHTEAVVANDLRLAERTLLAGGIAALDDILSYDWTGVLSGLVSYLAGGGTLVPFALVPNKLLLSTDTAVAERGRAAMLHGFPLAASKRNLEFLGGRVDSYWEHPYYSRESSAGLRLQIEDLHRQLASAQSEAERLRASASWRLTAPLRRVAALTRR